MPRSQKNDNFIDKTFTIVADILLRIIPTTQREKEAFTHYRDQSEGEYAEALRNYYEAMRLEIDPYDRSYIPYNIGLIHTSNGDHIKALEYYFQALERNPSLPQALNNMAVICHYVRLSISQILLVRKNYPLMRKNRGYLHINHKVVICL
nr:photosystem I assembly protein Ycf3 [Aneura pinguis]WGO59616.1 photosystem I assembly protein Ycf3 [Aneura pinguis]